MKAHPVKNGSKNGSKNDTYSKPPKPPRHMGKLNYMNIDNQSNIGNISKTFAEHRAQNSGYVVNKLGWAIYKIKVGFSEFLDFLKAF